MLKKTIQLVFALSLILMVEQGLAQDLLSSLPKTEQEFKATEPQVLATIAWLEKTPFDTEESKRKEQMMLLMGWVTNSPTVTIEINGDILTFTKKHPALLLTFFGGWTKFCLENEYSTDAVKGTLNGLKRVIAVYKNLGLKKDKEVEKLVALEEKGELENWVKSKLEKK